MIKRNDSLLRRVAFWALTPLILPQALWVRAHAPKFPPAPGEPHGRFGETGIEPLRFLALGDSVIAGVGAEQLHDAAPGAAARRLSEICGRPVAWRALGRVGADISQIRRLQLPEVGADEFDAALISVGVNDVTGLTRGQHYRRELGLLLDGLLALSPHAVILLVGVPPLHAFPLLPQPLRWHLGLRGRSLNAIGAQVASRPGVIFAPFDFDPKPEHFAADGYHPGPAMHREWGERVAELIATQLSVNDAAPT